MGKYGESLGVWELRVGGFNKDLHPKKGDNLRLARILTEAKKKKDEAGLLFNISAFIKELIVREYPTLNEIETEELDNYLEFNLIELNKELLLAFRWAKQKDFEKNEEESDSEKK